MLSRLLDDGVLSCPVCRGPTDHGLRNAPIALHRVVRDDGHGEPLQGTLRCTHCGTVFPIIDGIACIFADTRAWLRREERAVLGRADLDPELAGFLAEAWGESEDPSWRRQLLAVYGRQLPGIAPTGPAESLMRDLKEAGREAHAAARGRLVASVGPGARVLDAGCSVGVETLELARSGLSVVAFDQDFTSLRLLARLLREGEAHVPVWGAGGADFGVQQGILEDESRRERVVLVAGDVQDPPFAGAAFDAVVAHNLLDNVAEPVTAVRQLHGVVRPGGRLWLSSPFDWAERATPRAQRFGDGLRLAGGSTDPVPVLHALLEGRLPELAPEVACRIERAEDIPWVLVRHDRSAHVFATHMVEAARR